MRVPEVLEGLRKALRGWTPEARPVKQKDMNRPLAVVRGLEGAYEVSSRVLAASMKDLALASAVCAVIADAAQNFYESKPRSMALHCGSFLIRGRLVAMTGAAQAGKSTLMARLSAEPDLQILGDDLLPFLEDGLAHSLGAAPRIRLPLPENASDLFRAHVEAHCVLKDRLYGYVAPPTIAPFGLRAPLAALVVLEREAGAEARLSRLTQEEAVRQMMAQSIYATHMEEGAGFIDRLTDLAGSIGCFRLTYSDLEPAADLLKRAFGGEALPDPAVTIDPPRPPSPPPAAEQPAVERAAAALWRRSPEARVRIVGEELFVWHGATGRFLHMNAIAGAIWRLLEQSRTVAELAAMLAEAYPEVDPKRILNDVAALMADFQANDLLIPMGAAPEA